MSSSVDVLANITIELQHGIGHQDRFQRLITTLRQMLECDASVLLHYDPRRFIPLTIDELAKDVLGGRFALEGHPRLEAIACIGDVVRLPADDELPGSYDGLASGQESLKVHACVGLPLSTGQNLIGALTLDGMRPDQFDAFSDEELRLIAALAAGVLGNALLIEQPESQSMLPGGAMPFEAVRQMQVIGSSPGMTQLKKEIEIVTASDLNALISGETGTGKELAAKVIHEASPRAVNPLVYLNHAALPKSTAESELFGHAKGAFTDTISDRSGESKTADNSTLFLDEIGELSLALQAKLLRVSQYGDIQRIDDDRNLRADVCVLTATNRDLREEVLAKQSHTDLFHRLSAFPLSAPPLREQSDDVVLLAGYLREQCRLWLGPFRVVLGAGTRNLLQHYNFPGNARELEYTTHRVVVLSRATRSGDEVTPEVQHFAFPEVTLPPPETAAMSAVRQNLRETTEAFQHETIRQAPAQNHHNWAACVRMLETGVANLHRLARRLGLKD